MHWAEQKVIPVLQAYLMHLKYQKLVILAYRNTSFRYRTLYITSHM